MRPHLKNNKSKKRAGGGVVAQVAECLPSKALKTNPSTANRKNLKSLEEEILRTLSGKFSP
jgi:hypothetical protein